MSTYDQNKYKENKFIITNETKSLFKQMVGTQKLFQACYTKRNSFQTNGEIYSSPLSYYVRSNFSVKKVC